MHAYPCYCVNLPCSYLDRESTVQVLSPACTDEAAYNELAHVNFRRDGDVVYRPQCEGCRACRSLRVRTAEFVPNRTQRKILRRTQDWTRTLIEPTFFEEHFALFSRYEKLRHGGPMADMDEASYRRSLLGSITNTVLIEHRDPSAPGSPVRMVSVADILADGISAVYTFYDPDFPSLSLGTCGILWELMLARSLGLPYLYLGFWIRGLARMDYKERFRPFDVWDNDRWIDCEDPAFSLIEPVLP